MLAHGHDRSTAAARSRPMLAVTLALTSVMMVVEFVAGLWTGSLALLADAGHMLTDATALALALIAAWLAARPPTPAKTYGYYRAEILAALANALLLFGVAGSILVEAWHRVRVPAPVLAGPMAAVAAARPRA
jgi:cobalt-zinc-cadmium efflux system protein